MRGALLIVVALAVAGCHLFDSPPVSPHDYPCGARAYSCDGTAEACCTLGSICGGARPSCPAGMCCYDGARALASDAGVVAPSPQFAVRP